MLLAQLAGTNVCLAKSASGTGTGLKYMTMGLSQVRLTSKWATKKLSMDKMGLYAYM